jgi:predicted nucleotidyltransferase
MLEDIVDSKIKAKIVKVFIKRKDALHVSEVARLAKVSKSRASECLRELSEKGVLESKVIGRNVVYSISSNAIAKNVMEAFNQDEILLKKISKSFINEIKKIRKDKPISIALFGSALKELKFGSDIDFFVINGDKERFYKIASELTEKFGFRVSVLIMDYNELRKKARAGEEFAINLLANHKLLYGKKLEDLIW